MVGPSAAYARYYFITVLLLCCYFTMTFTSAVNDCCQEGNVLRCSKLSRTILTCQCTPKNALFQENTLLADNVVTSLLLEEILNFENCLLKIPVSNYTWTNFDTLQVRNSNVDFMGLSVASQIASSLLGSTRYLFLQQVGLKDIRKINLDGFSQLDFLSISGNNLSSLNNASFRSTSLFNLRTLILQRNQIKSLEEGTFENMFNLEKLDLSENEIERIPENMFNDLRGLRQFDISRNKIGALHREAVYSLYNLQSLNLSFNRLQHLEIVTPGLLDMLDISHNLLTTVSATWLNLMKRDGKVLLGGNNIGCDSNMAMFLYRARCDEEKQLLKNSSNNLSYISHVSQLLQKNSKVTLPTPGKCQVKRLQTECKLKTNKNIDACELLSYFALAKNNTASKEWRNYAFRYLLSRFDIFYEYLSSITPNDTKENRRAKQDIVKGLNTVAAQFQLEPSGSRSGEVGDDILVGMYEVDLTRSKNSKENESISGLGFAISVTGQSMFVLDSRARGRSYLTPPRDYSFDACETRRRNTHQALKQAQIILPRSVFLTQDQHKRKQRLVFVAYRNSFLFPSNAKLASSVISANVAGKTVKNLKEKVVVTAYADGNATGDYRCAYWSFNQSLWLDDGCETYQTDDFSSGQLRRKVTCHCDHLTNFGILLDFDPSQAKRDDEGVEIASYIGICFSLVGLIITIVYRLSIKELRRGIPQIILLHLCVSLLVLYVLLLLHDKSFITQNSSLCLFVGLSLQFFLYLVWGWQVIEALSMYKLIVRVFNVNMTYFLTKSTIGCIALSSAGVISSVVFSATNHLENKDEEFSIFEAYRYRNTCFIGYPNYLYFVIIPIAFTWIFNCIAFVLIVWELNRKNRSRSSKMERFKSRLRQAICLSSLLSLTWFFGFVKVMIQAKVGASHNAALVFDYIFAICNSFQGFVIFLMFCALRIWKNVNATKNCKSMFGGVKPPYFYSSKFKSRNSLEPTTKTRQTQIF